MSTVKQVNTGKSRRLSVPEQLEVQKKKVGKEKKKLSTKRWEKKKRN
jgi:hypothetical protein